MPQTQHQPYVASVRPARRRDLDAFQAMVGRLSLATSGSRFFSPATRIPRRQAELLLSSGPTRGAWVAMQRQDMVGHACWSRTAPTTAEVAVVVTDRLQGRGLGRSLMRAAVAEARAAGVRHLELVVQPGNRRMVDTIRRSWPEASVEHEPGTATFRVPLAAPAVPGRVEMAG